MEKKIIVLIISVIVLYFVLAEVSWLIVDKLGTKENLDFIFKEASWILK